MKLRPSWARLSNRFPRILRTGVPTIRRSVVQTALNNSAALGASGVAGLIIARQLGPIGRGEYAAVVAWFGVVLVAGEIGQPAALCYYVASDPDHGRDYVTTARWLMLASGIATATIGWFLAPSLARHYATLTTSYRLMFATCVISFVGASYVFALQARVISWWNATRLVQPVLYLTLTAALMVIGRLSVLSAIIGLATTVFVQAVLAWLLCRRASLTGGSFNLRLLRPLLRYGGSQIAASAPTTLNARLDQIILSTYAPYRILGLYAIAVSITSLALPFVSAIGDVVFPRIAARRGRSTRTLEKRATRTSLVIATTIMVIVALATPWLLPLAFGRAYSQAIPLVWILSAGGIFLASGQVMGDLLRGRGQPLAVAVSQGVGVAFTVGLLLALLPILGAAGAAFASTAAYFAAFVVLLAALRRPARTISATAFVKAPAVPPNQGV